MIFRQVVCGGQPVPAPADDDDVVMRLGVWIAPGLGPASMPG
ncbi:Uncharacterised protein [Bordetella pertussis]|nr:Uncharacterised protein [Bordetella pertussis]